MRKVILVTAALVAVIGGSRLRHGAAITELRLSVPWGQCCGTGSWPMGPQGTMRQGMMGSMPRHHQAMMSGIPAPYGGLNNPLPRTRETVERGAAVYADNCASCHGPTGRGDGGTGRDLSPPPGKPGMAVEDADGSVGSFMYWTIAEGGASFGTGMPAFKDTLSSDDIWAAIAYLQARLPDRPAFDEMKWVTRR